MTVIFKKSVACRRANSQKWAVTRNFDFDSSVLRRDKPILPALSELEVLRHFTKLSQKKFFY